MAHPLQSTARLPPEGMKLSRPKYSKFVWFFYQFVRTLDGIFITKMSTTASHVVASLGFDVCAIHRRSLQCKLDSLSLMLHPAGETMHLLLVRTRSLMCKYLFLENQRVSNW